MEALIDSNLENYQFSRSEFITAQLRLVPNPTDAELENEENDLKPEKSGESIELQTKFRRPDTVRIYLQEIGQIPLIDAKREVELAKQIESGLTATQKLKADNLSDDQKKKLKEAAQQGKRAEDALFEANLRLVVSIARRYQGRGLQLLDLIQEGNLGLMRAVEKFDHHRGLKFSTMATWWVRQAVQRALANDSRTIRIPVHLVEVINRLSKAQRDLEVELGRDPTEAELGERLEISADKVREVKRAALGTTSLDTPVTPEEETTRADLVIDEGNRNRITEETEQTDLSERLNSILDELPPQERIVLKRRFGLGEKDPEGQTYIEIGKELGINRERIKELEGQGLRKLRSKAEVRKQLMDFLN